MDEFVFIPESRRSVATTTAILDNKEWVAGPIEAGQHRWLNRFYRQRAAAMAAVLQAFAHKRHRETVFVLNVRDGELHVHSSFSDHWVTCRTPWSKQWVPLEGAQGIENLLALRR